MTSPLIRGRPRLAALRKSGLSVRVAHALVGVLVAVVWLVLPGMTISCDASVAVPSERPVAGASAQGEQEGNSATDLVVPLLVLGAAGVFAGYGFVRRTRRARSRTTPGGAARASAAEEPLAELDERARALLVEADDWVRASREELGFVESRFGEAEVEAFAEALRSAEGELAAAFRMRERYDAGLPEEEASRRQVLAGIVGRCQEAGRLLDAQAAAFDQLRGLEEGLGGGLGAALAVAETRFRELAGRTGSADATLADLAKRYAPAATAAVAGHAEQAKDRLVFATSRLNDARQSADLGETARAARQLRAAEGAVAQAAVFVDGVERLAGELARAAAMVPTALTGGEAEIAGARAAGGSGSPALPAGNVTPGELRARVVHADFVLGGVRAELTAGVHDPLDALRRIVRAVAPVFSARAGVIPAAAMLTASSAVAGADDVVATHRGAVGSEARIRLAEARRLLRTPLPARPPAAPPAAPQTPPAAPTPTAAAPPPTAVSEPPGTPTPPGASEQPGAWAPSGTPASPGAAEQLGASAPSGVPGQPGAPGRPPASEQPGGSASDGTSARLSPSGRPGPSVPPGREPRPGLADLIAADILAQQARDLAEQDVRLHGNPLAGADGRTSGLAGAVLGGILSGGAPDGGAAVGFGGPRSRARRTVPPGPAASPFRPA